MARCIDVLQDISVLGNIRTIYRYMLLETGHLDASSLKSEET